jgi:hypothetical protein
MLGAMIGAMEIHWKSRFFWKIRFFAMNNGIELPMLYAAGALAPAITGPGDYSVDALFGLQALWSPVYAWPAIIAASVGGLGSFILAARRGR